MITAPHPPAARPVSPPPSSRADALIRLWLGLVAAGVFVLIFADAAARPLAAAITAALGPEIGGAAVEQLADHHFMFGRLIGLVFLAPLPWIFARPGNGARLAAPLAIIALLGAAQAAAGWEITQFERVHGVSASGLLPALHVMLAAALLTALIFTSVGLAPHFRDPLGRDARNFRPLAWSLLALILLQFGLGAYAAGFAPAQWLPPAESFGAPQLIATRFSFEESFAAVLDNGAKILLLHRLVAYVLLGAALLHALHLGREKLARRAARRGFALAALCLLQLALGAALFWLGAPPTLTLAHQFLALTLLALASAHVRKLG